MFRPLCREHRHEAKAYEASFPELPIDWADGITCQSEPPVACSSPMPVRSAAIPYRYSDQGEIEVLLVTSRKKRRWIIPQGRIRVGMMPHASAAKEAFDGAGVLGRSDPVPIASYSRRQKADYERAIRVDVYPLAVTTEAPVWPEMHVRQRRWASISEAISIASNKGLRHALTVFGTAFE